MEIDKTLLAGSTTMLVLKLLEEKDMYGYEMIESLSKKSDDTFHLKAGTLYPILHGLEKKAFVESYENSAMEGRVRKYYHLTDKGKKQLSDKKEQWKKYSVAVNSVLKGGVSYAYPL